MRIVLPKSNTVSNHHPTDVCGASPHEMFICGQDLQTPLNSHEGHPPPPTIPPNLLLIFHLPGHWESKKHRAENLREDSCVQKIFAGGLRELEEMLKQILKRKPILMRYIRRPNELLQQLDVVFRALYFYKLQRKIEETE